MAHIVVREIRGLRYWSVRDGQSRQLAWLGRDPKPEAIKAAVKKYGIKLERYAAIEEAAFNAR